jgi:hypothetical protein
MNLRYTTPDGTVITLSNVRLTGFTVQNVFDGESFNRSGREETITGTAIITGNPLTSSSGSIDVIRNRLNAPRGKLELQFTSDTGTWYVLADGRDNASSNYDAQNGPLPNVSVSRIEGTHSTAVTFVSFSYTYHGCGDTRIQKFEMSVVQSLDEAGFITMTRTGSLKVSNKPYSLPSAIANVASPKVIPDVQNVDSGRSPDLYRYLVSGKPGPFFRRVRQDYTLDASLTTLSFTVEDRMVFRELKYPVMMGDASFSYERTLGGGLAMMGQKSFSCHFEGSPDTPPGHLLMVAIEAAQARIDFEHDLVQSLTVREPNIYTRNRVELAVTAVGQSDKPVDPNVVRDMFTDPHSQGDTRYVGAYGAGGFYLQTINGLKWDACQTPSIISTIVQSNPDDGAATQTTLTVITQTPDADLKSPDGKPIGKPIETDSADKPDNSLKHLDGNQDINTEDSGMRLLEAMGGAFQWPMQIRMPQVIVTQNVQYISNNTSAPIPYPSVNDPFIVLNERIIVNNAPPDVTGKPVFAVVAKRQIQIQTSSSSNTFVRGENFPRRVWSPESVQQSRGLFSRGNTINNRQLTDDGSEVNSDYSST